MAECAAFDECFEIFVGGADDADIDKSFPRVADAPHGFFLNGAQEFDLHRQRQIGYFVKKQRAAVGVLEETETVLVGTGEAAFFVTEKLAFHQIFGDGAAVDGNEGFVGPVGKFVDGARSLFFTGAGFAGNIDGHAAARQTPDKVADFDHLRRHSEQAGHIRLAAEFGRLFVRTYGDFTAGEAFFYRTQAFGNGNRTAQIAFGRFGRLGFGFVERRGDRGGLRFFRRRLRRILGMVGNGYRRFDQGSQLREGNRFLQIVECAGL